LEKVNTCDECFLHPYVKNNAKGPEKRLGKWYRETVAVFIRLMGE